MRWRLHRGGVVNIWQYSVEEFDLSGGRAIFQGTNGSGKSRTLELLAPLCLDGDLHQLPIAALPAAGGGYLVEALPRHHVLGAARDLVLFADERPPEVGRGILALGSPDFDAAASARLASLEPGALADTVERVAMRLRALRLADLPVFRHADLPRGIDLARRAADAVERGDAGYMVPTATTP